MHNTYPQMGKWNNSLGCMVYEETPQMGSMGTMGASFSVKDFFNKQLDALGTKAETMLKTAPQQLVNTMYATALKDPKVQQKIIENGEASFIQQLQDLTNNAVQTGYVYIKENPWKTVAFTVGGVVVVGGLLYLAFRGARK